MYVAGAAGAAEARPSVTSDEYHGLVDDNNNNNNDCNISAAL